ncbi:MAG: TolC family protein [Pseudomonadota bacterium]|nr:TolC family protein [Pseudomonadota bacterium]
MKRHLAYCLALLASGCATYHPVPLSLDGGGVDLSLASIQAVLARDAQTIDRPYLTPTAIDLSRPLDLNAISVIAVIANPDLKAMRVRAGVSEAQVFSARLIPDPTFSIGANKVLSGPDPFLDLASAVGQDINALRTRGARIAVARAQAQQVRLDLAWAEWQTAGQARIQAVRIAGLERTYALARASYEATASLLDRTMRAAGRGDLNPDQVQAARLSAYSAQQQLRTSQRDLTTARFELTRLLGLPPGTELALAALPLPAPPPSADVLFALALRDRTDLHALQAGYASQEASVRLAVLNQFPTLTFTAHANRDSAGNQLLGPSIDFTLPLWNRNRGGIAIERATRAALKAEYDGRVYQTRAQIAAAVGGIAVARSQRETVLKGLPALRTFAAATARAAKRGDLAPATAQTAAQSLRDQETLLTQTTQDLEEQTIALELLTGTPRETWP